ncbi:MAG: hypothetical protein SVU32_08480, partial [Candidatus Nanohaloarchaea archaeon]|nr:hypothetical protein [Candidatus Nanohaloarchaea archaeon]
MDLGLDRRDFQTVLVLALVDLAFTITGNWEVSRELSPFFRPFTHSVSMLFLGSGVYVAILLALNMVLRGRLRMVLASTASGMHLMGITTWVTSYLLPVLALRRETLYFYFILLSV